MVLKIFVIALFLAVTFFQSLHGLFSAMIMLVLTVLCAALSLTHFEWLNETLVGSFLGEYGPAVALMALFLVPLGLLRAGIDKVIPGNMVLPSLVDRVGAPVLGIGTGIIVSGMVAIAFQLLPFDAELLGFQRVTASKGGEPVLSTTLLRDFPTGSDVEYNRDNLWLNPDGLTASLAGLVSKGTFSGGLEFNAVHPDFLEEIHWRRWGTQRESRHIVKADALTILEAKELGNNDVWTFDGDFPPDTTPSPKEPVPPDPNSKYLAFVVTLKSGDDYSDKNDTHRFRGGQFRLVCRNPDTGEVRQLPLAALCYAPKSFDDRGKYRYFSQGMGAVLRGTGEGVGIAFDVPNGFEPWFIDYKGARTEVPKKIQIDADAATSSLSGQAVAARSLGVLDAWMAGRRVPLTAAIMGAAVGQQGGRVSGRYIKKGEARFSDKLPLPIDRAEFQKAGADLRGDKFDEGHVSLEVKAPEGDNLVKEFVVPEGKRLFQLGVDRRQAKSILGRSMQFARETVGQYTVTDDVGNTYFRIGELRVADVNGREMLEMQYWPNAEMPERCIREFRTVKDSHLKDNDYTMVLFFLIPDGRTPKRFSVGPRNATDIGDIKEE